MEWQGIAVVGIWLGVGMVGLRSRGDAPFVALWAMVATVFIAISSR